MSTAAVVGTGLIGGSLGAALRRSQWFVRGTDADPLASAEAARLGLIDEALPDVQSCVSEADLVVLAVPVGAVVKILPLVDGHAPREATIIDTGSVKRPVVAAMQALVRAERAVGGHPLAGSHRTGPGAAGPDLFLGQTFVICPSDRTSAETMERAASFARAIGALPRTLSAREHDRSVAVISHLPQILSSLLALQPADRTLAGPGYRDMTRLAASDADMWAEILLSNRDEVLQAMSSFRASLDTMAGVLSEGDRHAARHVLEQGRERVIA